MTLRSRPARVEDAAAIQLRPEDLHEATLWAPGQSPVEALAASIKASQRAWTVSDEAGPVAVYGYSTHESRVHPWLMCSDRAGRHGRVILRVARAFLQDIQRSRPGSLVCNYVNRDNLQAKRLLRALGFQIAPAPGSSPFEFFHLP